MARDKAGSGGLGRGSELLRGVASWLGGVWGRGS